MPQQATLKMQGYIHLMEQTTNDMHDIEQSAHQTEESIKAARAGEMGKGFSVVAEEVRVLADSSKQASDAISGIIQKIFSLLKEVNASNNENLNNITEGIEKLHAVVQEADTGQ